MAETGAPTASSKAVFILLRSITLPSWVVNFGIIPPVQPPNRKDYLERLIPGLEMAIEDLKARQQYYPPEDLEGKYAKKFLASMEENLAKAQKEYEELSAKGEESGGKP